MRPYLYPALTIVAILFVGVYLTSIFALYEIRYFDKLMHFLGGLTAAWFLVVWLSEDLQKLSRLKSVLVIVACVSLIGVFWEFGEFLASQAEETLPTFNRLFYGGGLEDTLADLAIDLIGGLLFSFLYINRKRS